MSLLNDVLLGNTEAVKARLLAQESTEFSRPSGIWFGLASRPETPSGEPTLLHVAAETNDTDSVTRLLLDAGLQVDARDHFSNTPLHIAARNKHLATMRLLLERGADVNAEDCAGYTAIDHGLDYDVFEILLAHRANPNGGPRIVWPSQRYEGWPLLEQVASLGKDNLMRMLLDAGADLTKHPRALRIACERKYEDVVTLLLERSADPTAALHDIAIANEKFLRILLDHGANPNVLNASEETPLAEVVRRGLHRPARMLIEKGADVHGRLFGGESLYEAAQRSYKAGVTDARLVMQLLKEVGAAPVVADASKPLEAAPSGPQAGARVTHSKFGGGVLTKVEKDMLDVTFDSGEKKSLLAKFVKLA